MQGDFGLQRWLIFAEQGHNILAIIVCLLLLRSQGENFCIQTITLSTMERPINCYKMLPQERIVQCRLTSH